MENNKTKLTLTPRKAGAKWTCFFKLNYAQVRSFVRRDSWWYSLRVLLSREALKRFLIAAKILSSNLTKVCSLKRPQMMKPATENSITVCNINPNITINLLCRTFVRYLYFSTEDAFCQELFETFLFDFCLSWPYNHIIKRHKSLKRDFRCMFIKFYTFLKNSNKYFLI